MPGALSLSVRRICGQKARERWPRLGQSFCAWSLAVALVSPVAAQAPSASAVEMEFWRSAERIATPDAYRAYLAAFPSGVFAPLARAALAAKGASAPEAHADKLDASNKSEASTKGDAGHKGERKAATNLRYFSESPPNTGAIPFNLGDRLVGPGAVTIGWIGAKKQVPLPAGEWVVLAASDSRSEQWSGTAGRLSRIPLDLTTVVFGKFSGETLSTALRVTTNSRPATVPTWSDVAGCDLAAPLRLHHARSKPSSNRDECIAIRRVANPFEQATVAMLEARTNLSRIGGRAEDTAVATIVSIAEWADGYLGVTRLDWPGQSLGADADAAALWTPQAVQVSPARAEFIKGLLDWSEAYRVTLSEGYRRALKGPDLEAKR